MCREKSGKIYTTLFIVIIYGVSDRDFWFKYFYLFYLFYILEFNFERPQENKDI